MNTQLESGGIHPSSARQITGGMFGQDKLTGKSGLAEGRESRFFRTLLFSFYGLAGSESKGFLKLPFLLEDGSDSHPGFSITLAEVVPPGGKRAYTIGSIRAMLIQLIADKRVAGSFGKHAIYPKTTGISARVCQF